MSISLSADLHWGAWDDRRASAAVRDIDPVRSTDSSRTGSEELGEHGCGRNRALGGACAAVSADGEGLIAVEIWVSVGIPAKRLRTVLMFRMCV